MSRIEIEQGAGARVRVVRGRDGQEGVRMLYAQRKISRNRLGSVTMR